MENAMKRRWVKAPGGGIQYIDQFRYWYAWVEAKHVYGYRHRSGHVRGVRMKYAVWVASSSPTDLVQPMDRMFKTEKRARQFAEVCVRIE
jgi:hypothetical protein